MKTHTLPVRIYYEDTDAGGIVYHANYLRFCERARSEMLREADCNNARFVAKTGLMFVVRHIDIHYLVPAYLDDSLTVESRAVKIGGASFTLQQNIYRDGETVAEVRVVLVCINRETGRPVKIPDEPRNALSAYITDKMKEITDE